MERKVSLAFYVERKIKILKQMEIRLTNEQEARLRTAKSYIQVDNIARAIMSPPEPQLKTVSVWCGDI